MKSECIEQVVAELIVMAFVILILQIMSEVLDSLGIKSKKLPQIVLTVLVMYTISILIRYMADKLPLQERSL